MGKLLNFKSRASRGRPGAEPPPGRDAGLRVSLRPGPGCSMGHLTYDTCCVQCNGCGRFAAT